MKANKVRLGAMFIIILGMIVNLASAEPLQLNSVTVLSTNNGVSTDLSGSLKGKTTIFISGAGFDPVASQNTVLIGNYPCLTDSKGVNANTLTCDTSDSQLTTDSGPLKITVIAGDQQKEFDTSLFTFSYSTAKTPFLSGIYPSTSVGNSKISFYGIHKIAAVGSGLNLGDTKGFYIGESICDRIAITNENDVINPSVNNYISCIQAEGQEAGKYNVREEVTPGLAVNNIRMRRTSFNLEPSYEFAVLPGISTVSPTSGAVGGGMIKIKGTGFSTETSKIQVKVDNVDCKVQSSTLTEVNCQLRAKTANDDTKITTADPAAQVKGYIGGSGFSYQRYDATALVVKTAAGLRNAIIAGSATITLVESGVRAEIMSHNTLGTNYGQVYKGYFKAPETGEYNFSAIADDSFSMYFNTVPGTAVPSAAPLFQFNDYNFDATKEKKYQNPFIMYLASSFSSTVTLVKNSYYYMEVYHYNYIGNGGMKLSVETPNPNNVFLWQTPQVIELSTSFTNSPQIMKFTFTSATVNAIYNLKLVRYNGTKIILNQNTNVTANSTVAQFISSLGAFSSYAGYGLTGTMTSTSVNGVFTTVYTINIETIRDIAWPKDKFIATPITNQRDKFAEDQVRVHSPAISGTFTLPGFQYWNSVTMKMDPNIPFDISEEQFQSSLRRFTGMSAVEVIRTSTNPAYGAKWLITYAGVNQNLWDSSVIPSAMNLVGGATGTRPTVQIVQKRSHRSRLTFDVVDHNFLFMASSAPNVQVTVNGLMSVCVGTCSYTFTTVVPEISAASLSGSTLTIGLTIPVSLTVALTDITVMFDMQTCSSLTGTSASFTCSLPTNIGSSSPVVRAGAHMPKVTIANIGNILPATGVTPINVDLTLTSSLPTSVGVNGGRSVVLTGHGFPFAVAEAQITICSKKAIITSINNIQTTILAPTCANAGSQTISYVYKTNTGANITKTLSLTYTSAPAISITSISPTTASPVLKGIMTIVGSGFGTDASLVSVSLANTLGTAYKFRVVEVNNTHIKAGIPGGLKGTYSVKVSIGIQGDAVPVSASANEFKYDLSVTSVFPTAGSHFGGTLVTITGTNFSPDILENLVFVGQQMNWFCDIESLTTTTILCRTPPRHQADTSGINNISVTNKLISESNCQGTCVFSYDLAANAPTITAVSLTMTYAANAVTLTGTNFATAGLVVFKHTQTGKQTVVTPTRATPTSVVFNVPNVQAGKYTVQVRQDPYGESNRMSIEVGMTVNADLSPTALSIHGGEISVRGTGLPDGWPNSRFELSYLVNTILQTPNIVLANPSTLTFKVPTGENAWAYSITIKTDAGVSVTKTFSQTNSATPNIVFITTTIQPMASTAITVNRTTSAGVPTQAYLYNINQPTKMINVSSFATQAVMFTFNTTLKSGKYGLRALYPSGWADTKNSLLRVDSLGSYSIQSATLSYGGGIVKVSGTNIAEAAVVRIGGVTAKFLSSTPTEASFSVPAFVTTRSLATYPELAPVQKMTVYTMSGDNSAKVSNVALANDGSYGTSYSSIANECYLMMDFGINKVKLNRIRYFPHNKWTVASNYFKGGKFQWSNDNITWATISTIDGSVHVGWNTIVLTAPVTSQYVRFSHTKTSQCRLAQFQAYGSLLNVAADPSIPNYTSSATFNDGLTEIILANAVVFREDLTSVVTGVQPKNGNVFGNYPITISGTFPAGTTATVTIDGINCVVSGFTTTSITCTVGSRLVLPSSNSFIVKIDGNSAILRATFKYVMRWSDIRTWGTDLPPIDDDLVVVPKGMTLLVDQTTPNLKGIIVDEGTIIFSDEADMVIEAGFITINKGKFFAGTQASPYQHKLTFLMHGRFSGRHQPIFGNKGIGCMECQFSLFGKRRTPTWTMLQSTINVGATSLTLQEDIDWQIGEKIVVASTSFDHTEAEEAVIKTVTGRTIEVEKPFKFKHYAGEETYGSHKLIMRAEVGLLSRNILMRGDDESVATDYGSHLLMAGKSENGLKATIAYTQFTKCGQPAIVGRYCIHFHMNGDVMDSYVQGNAVHHSMARVITIHGVHYLRVSKNVGYQVKGHNFFIEDGIETNNVIEYNLAIKTLQVWNMMQTDISAASFWITNPTNHLRFNHAAGGDFYAFWYEIKSRPDGPSSTSDVCPIGNELGQSHDNVAHSYMRFGLRIFRLNSRANPCAAGADFSKPDPWSVNTAIESKFYNYLIYKTGEAAVLAEEMGYSTFDNFTIAESKLAGIQFYRTNLTRELTVFKNSAVIGVSNGNPPSEASTLARSSGIITPRTDGLNISGINFYNFGSTMVILEVCSLCSSVDLFINTARQTFIQKITYTNVTSNYMKMNGLKRNIIHDMDGSFTNGVFDSTTRTSATVVNAFSHLLEQPQCSIPTSASKWGTSLACDQTITLRKVGLGAPRPLSTLKGTLMNVKRSVPTVSTAFSQVDSMFGGMQPMLDKKTNWEVPMITGRTYKIWWRTGIDFTHIAIDSSKYFKAADDAIVLEFNHTDARQLFEILHMYTPNNKSDYISRVSSPLVHATCRQGDYYTDPEPNITLNQRILQVCVSGKGKAQFELLSVNGIGCRLLCPRPITDCPKESIVKYWSDASIWPNGRLPIEGQNVTIPCAWTIMMDVDPAAANVMEVNGDIYIPATTERGNVKIKANVIWIRAGSLNAGTDTVPFPNKLTIQLTGSQNDRGIVVDQLTAGNKMLVVSGKLNLYGKKPASSWTKMTATSLAGSSTITVIDATDWVVGDSIAISASFSSFVQDEQRTITDITGNTITLDTPLQFTHYGDPDVTISNSYGILDTRTPVGLLTRNIKITRGGPDTTWGFRVLALGFSEIYPGFPSLQRMGNIKLHGVELVGGGQKDTERAAIHIFNVYNSTNTIEVISCSIHNSGALGLNIENSYQIAITGNVFYKAITQHVLIGKVKQYLFNNNIMMRVQERLGVEQLVACYAQYDGVDVENDGISVRDNICTGSSLHGIAIPHIICSKLALNPFINNVVGSSKQGFIMNKIDGDCMGASGLKAYACQICHLGGMPGTAGIVFDGFMMADCGRAVTLRFGRGGSQTDSSANFTNSYITAISRPTCAQCYGSTATKCRSNHAVRLLAVTVNGQVMPDKYGMSFDVICKQQNFDAKSFASGNKFQNFRISYSEPALQSCSDNVLFRPHAGNHDLTGSYNSWNSTCANCEIEAYGLFDHPTSSDLGWLGGCGLMFCTGKNNYLIEDHDGTLIPGGGQLLANNSWIGNGIGCKFYSKMNGHHCIGKELGVLHYESIAADYNTRIMWPVYLNYTGGNWTTETNGWRQWQWQGNQPLNLRLARFVSVIQYRKEYNMSFSAMPPIDMRLQFQKRTWLGNNQDWIIVKLSYPQANSIRISVNGVTITPNILGANQRPLEQSVTVCGANKYFYFNNTIHFVITGKKDCLVRVNLISTIKLTAKFEMSITDFFAQNLATKFIDRMAALLGITDTSRIKIVGIYNGSVSIQVVIQSATPNVSTNNTTTVSDTQSGVMAAKIQQITSTGALQADLSSNGFGTLLSITQTIVNLQSTSTPPNNPNTLIIIIVATIGSVLILGALAVATICVIRKRARIGQATIVYPDQMDENAKNQNIPEESLIDFWKK